MACGRSLSGKLFQTVNLLHDARDNMIFAHGNGVYMKSSMVLFNETVRHLDI